MKVSARRTASSLSNLNVGHRGLRAQRLGMSLRPGYAGGVRSFLLRGWDR